jgi:pimeloyl-ACP methyl ester carboxylesterase
MSTIDAPVDGALTLPNGLRLAYRDWGGAGQPIVLIHGLASSYTIWNLVAPRLAERHRVVAVDQRGHGRSDRPSGPFDFSTYVGDLRGFLDALGLERSVLVGHSWGGNVSVQFAADQPDRTAGLVLVDGGFIEFALREGWSWERTERELAPPDLSGLTPEALFERVSQGPLAPVWSEAVGQAVLGHFEPLPDGRIQPWLRREHHMQILRALWEHRPSLLWERLECPVLIVPARTEPIEGPRADLWAARLRAVALAEQRLPRGRVLWMEDTVHDVPLHRPAELAAAIESLVAETDQRAG